MDDTTEDHDLRSVADAHTLIMRFIFSFNKSIHKTTKSTTLNLVGWIRVSSGCHTNLCDITHTVGIGDGAKGGL